MQAASPACGVEHGHRMHHARLGCITEVTRVQRTSVRRTAYLRGTWALLLLVSFAQLPLAVRGRAVAFFICMGF